MIPTNQSTVSGWMLTNERSPLIPIMCRQCLSDWDLKGKTKYNCTNEDLNPEDLTRPCLLFIRELEFNKKLSKKKKEKGQYNKMDINEMSRSTRTPVEIVITTRRKKKRTMTFHCGKTQLSDEEQKRGWCATKVDWDGMIKIQLFPKTLEKQLAQ